MARPTGVTIAAAIFFLGGASMGFLAVVLLTGSFGLVQNPRGTTGIFGNTALGGIGLFLGAIILAIAAAIAYLGLGLWRMQKWARVAAIVLWGACGAFFLRALLNSLLHPALDVLLTGPVFTGMAFLMARYLVRPDVKDAFDKAGPAAFRPLVMAAPRATPRS